MKKVFVNSVAAISAQKTFEDDYFFEHINSVKSNTLNAVNPNYKEYIPAAAARRMAKGIKMGVVCAKKALANANLQTIDAIITGTGMGCIQDSEKFVSAIIDNDEQYLTPTSFIQSTHNTVGGQIALELQCKGYNFTYVHASNSFESALLDATLQLENNEEKNILVGGVDEMGKHTNAIHKLIHHIKEEEVFPEQLLSSNTKGTIFGEGANFFVLSNEKQTFSFAEVVGVKILNTLEMDQVVFAINQFLQDHNVAITSIDALILGNNGDVCFDTYYLNMAKHFTAAQQLYYKHVTGDYNTASSFGFWLASKILKKQEVPEILKLNQSTKKTFQYVLIYNQYRGENHSFTLLKKC